MLDDGLSVSHSVTVRVITYTSTVLKFSLFCFSIYVKHSINFFFSNENPRPNFFHNSIASIKGARLFLDFLFTLGKESPLSSRRLIGNPIKYISIVKKGTHNQQKISYLGAVSFARMLRLLFRRISSISRSRRFFGSSRMEPPRGSSDRVVVPVASTGYRICPSPCVGLLPINPSRTRPTDDDAAAVDSVHRRRPISSLLFNKGEIHIALYYYPYQQ